MNNSNLAKQSKKYRDAYLLKAMWAYVKPHKKLFYLIVVILLISIFFVIASPLMFKQVVGIIEKGLTGDLTTKEVYWGAGLYFLFGMISWLLRITYFAAVRAINARFVRDLRIDAFNNILENQIAFFDNNEVGDLTSRIINDSRELQNYVNSLAMLFTRIFRLAIILAVLFYLSPLITLSTMAIFPLIFLIAKLLGGYQRKVSRIWRKKLGKVNQSFSESIKAIQVSKSFNRENENIQRFHKINEETFQASKKRGFAIFLFWPITDIMKYALLAIILATGSWQIQKGLDLGTMLVFLLLIDYYYWPLIGLADNYHKFQGVLANFERIWNVAQGSQLKEMDQGKYKADIKGEITFENLYFAYEPPNNVLKDISFQVKPKERVAIVGHTGAGKTTIASLLLRFYPITQGTIKIDGKNINEWDLKTLRKQIGLVSQRILLFRGTIRENLLIANTKATDEELWDALEKVQAREFIEQLPGKLDYEVHEGGKNLSVGQRQMISFARALLKKPKIIILDEATSAVDLYTEAKIQDAIDTILQNVTSITIAHRLTTIVRSDKIIVLEKGKIVQQGTHEQLVNQEGPYKEMYEIYYQTQSAKYLEKIKARHSNP